jgi:hypothetical protein
MNPTQFDRLTRRISLSSSRRSLLGGVLSGIGVHGLGQETTAGAQGRRKGKGGHRCRGLRGGVVATFDVVGERFRVWVTNPQTIQQIFDLRDGTSQATIPNGRLLRGPGRRRHNAPWHWHLDPQEIEMAENAIELCDATPSFVESNRNEFIEQVGRYCPWSAQLVNVVDCR